MFNFIKLTPIYFLISAIFLVPGVISLFLFGLKPGIDFTGGTLLELKITPQESITVNEDVIRQNIPADIEVASIQTTTDTYIIRSKPLSNDQSQQLQNNLEQKLGQVEEIRYETVGPTLGKELLRKTYVAIALAAVAILLYVAYQFKEIKYGISAVMAMLHDTLIVVGVFSLLGHFYGIEVDTLFVTAVLTIMSFSVHDTIVVYDRIRETRHRHSSASLASVANTAIAETLSRSINNSMTIIFMLTALWLMGGETTKWFVFALLIGTIVGTYSSTFTATPILVVWEKYVKPFNRRRYNR